VIKTITLGFVNVYLVDVTDGFILVDTGLPVQRERLERELAAAGVVPGNLKLVIITHGDWDHTGNAALMQEKYKAKIAIHAEDAYLCEQLTMLKRKVRPFMLAVAFAVMRRISRLQGERRRLRPFKPDILLSDGQDLGAYGFNAKVVHLPGHTKGSIGILTAEGDLLVGDTYFNRGRPVGAQIILDEAALKATFARLEGMEFKMAYPGHGMPFAKERLTRSSVG
jgi:hydroxyacylglutathione hydrolase